MRVAIVSLALGACHFLPGQVAAIDGTSAAEDAPRDSRAADTSVDTSPVLDAPLSAVPRDCLAAYQGGITTDGILKIDPDGPGGNAPFDVYCDMTTSGGGWTLVWVYGFTAYAQFTSGSNAVTPRPTWGVPATGGTPTSTTVPLAPTTPGALDFAQWASIGSHLLVKSNINHWITCAPGTGSLVTKTDGSMTCSIVQLVATACTTVVPSQFAMDSVSAGLYATANPYSTYYYWEGSTVTANWPTHDPCGSNQANQLTGVVNPYGAIYLRP